MIILESNAQNTVDTIFNFFNNIQDAIVSIYSSIPIFVQPIVVCYIMISLAFLFLGKDA